ncbi:hypothetical protein [Brevundimonas sp.]|uniref:hypothetical protein n=1 Tax=Brevundimonas sp. TaxID=1871086 RepID=UPI0028983CB8|nr:hypothetical protein [Brevundimonas sp.]
MESNVIWVDFGKRGGAIDWLELAENCEAMAQQETRPRVRKALEGCARAYRAKVRAVPDARNG